MNLVVVGTNYKYSPIELRERLSFSRKRIRDALFFLKERDVLKAAVILSTCNRVEVYASADELEIGIREIEDFISRYHEISKAKLSPFLYRYKDKEAIRHLFLVSSGLDSLILGETQVLGQVKFFFYESESVGYVDGFLRKIFFSAFSTSKRVHRETRISEGKVSVGSLAIDFIRERLSTLSGKNVLIIGAGKVTELVLRYLRQEQPNVVFISSRSFEKAKELAAQIGAKAVRFDKLNQFLREADVVITATSSPHFIIKKEIVEGTIGSCRLLIIDLALPRDVDPRVKEIENVDLFCLEDLDTVIKKNMEKRSQEAYKANNIIDIEVKKLWNELIELEPEPALLR